MNRIAGYSESIIPRRLLSNPMGDQIIVIKTFSPEEFKMILEKMSKIITEIIGSRKSEQKDEIRAYAREKRCYLFLHS